VSTESTTGLEAVLRTRLLTFEPLDGSGTVASALGSTQTGAGSDGNLYWDRAPDNLDRIMAAQGDPLRWGVLRLKNWRDIPGQSEGKLTELEVMLYGRPRSQRATLQGVADRMDQAMVRWVDAESGVVAASTSTRNTLPPFKEPADADVVQVMLEYTLRVYPAYLTQYHDES
jgi:hypothetical protein